MRAHRTSDEARLSAAVIATNILSDLCRFADEHGVACAPWFAGSRLTRAQIDDPGVRVSYRQASEFVHHALRALPAPDVGLALGCRQNIGNFGVLGLAMMTARTFGDAVAIGLEYSAVSGTLMDLELDVDDAGIPALVATQRAPDAEILPFLCEELFASTLMMARGLLGSDLVPLRVDLAYPAPAYAARYRDAFGCDVRFAMPRNRMLVDPEWLSRPLPTYNPVNAQQALALCRAQMPDGHHASEIVTTVRSLLRRQLQQAPRLADIAAELHLTERTLRRQLTAAGTGFKDLHDRVRCEHAVDLLRDRRMSIAQVGASVGFKDAREFRRAFKRWTGNTPSEARSG